MTAHEQGPPAPTARPVIQARLISDGPLDGAANMARDEALLESARQGGPPAVRLYGWSRPTLSLGAHQPSSDVDLVACRARGIDLVRRPTGGGAVLHDAELTYAVAGRLGEPPFPSSVVGIYDTIAAALLAGFARLGVQAVASRSSGRGGPAPAHCFSAPSAREILVAGRKLAGSAQLRRSGAFLQHGSILIDWDPSRIEDILSAGAPTGTTPGLTTTGGAEGAHPADGEGSVTTLRAELGRTITIGEVGCAMAGGFIDHWGARFALGPLTPGEEEEAARLRSRKYLDALWTLEGHLRN